MTDIQRAQVIQLRKAGNSYGSIARTVGILLNTVKSFCRRNNITENADAPVPVILIGEITLCENCGREIRQITKRKKKRFCCDKCRNEWWNKNLDKVQRKTVYEFICPHCGKAFSIYCDSRRKYCSYACYIADRFGGGGNE
ncbi:MAG: RNA polymerase subunit sigma-70 [Ruminococcus sp.]|nr:RNA polymerase subunit sigma-70 [Ruminococcus sp.]